jgi:hypothetical protein
MRPILLELNLYAITHKSVVNDTPVVPPAARPAWRAAPQLPVEDAAFQSAGPRHSRATRSSP